MQNKNKKYAQIQSRRKDIFTIQIFSARAYIFAKRCAEKPASGFP